VAARLEVASAPVPATIAAPKKKAAKKAAPKPPA
jgi:hypothetical protein